MNNDATAPYDLISRHFDDDLSAAERATLAERLRRDPAAALEFVRTARVHGLLEGLAPPRPAGSAVVRRRWMALGAAAALVVTGAGLALHFFSEPPREESARPHVVIFENDDQQTGRKPLPPGVNLRKVRATAAAALAAPVSLDFLLDHFYVHASPDRMQVPEALRVLERAIGEANVLGRRELTALRFTAGRGILPEFTDDLPEFTWQGVSGDDKPIIEYDPKHRALEHVPWPLSFNWSTHEVVSPRTPPFTIREYLNICGLFREVIMQPGGLQFAAPPVTVHPLQNSPFNTRIETRKYRISPDLFGHWTEGNADPDLLDSDLLQRKIRERLGVTLRRDETASFSREESGLSVTTCIPKLERIQQVLEVAAQRRSVQHYLTTKYLCCSPGLLPSGFDAATGLVMNESEFLQFQTRLSQSSVEVEVAPDVLVRPGQGAAILIQCDVPGSPPGPDGTSDWLGLRQEILTTCVGETIQVSGLVDFGLPAHSGALPLAEIMGEPGKLMPHTAEGVRHYLTGYDLWIPHRGTALFTLDVPSPEQLVTVVCVTAMTLDPAGQPVEP